MFGVKKYPPFGHLSQRSANIFLETSEKIKYYPFPRSKTVERDVRQVFLQARSYIYRHT